MKAEEGRASQSYTALSYCWGDPKFDGKIILSGHEFSVTKSLEAGLKRMRYGDGKKVASHVRNMTVIKEYFWIDQICTPLLPSLLTSTNETRHQPERH